MVNGPQYDCEAYFTLLPVVGEDRESTRNMPTGASQLQVNCADV